MSLLQAMETLALAGTCCSLPASAVLQVVQVVRCVLLLEQLPQSQWEREQK